MAEYSSLKVPELKKLLAEKGLSQTGNKADLVARLGENDKKQAEEVATEKPAETADNKKEEDESKEDEITYSDDEAPVAPAKPDVDATAAPLAAASTEDKEEESAPAAEEAASATENPVAAEEKSGPSFAIGLESSAVDVETKKRADRAKRFGIEEDEDSKKRADRASRFGIDEKELASGLDSALPERPLKRGRGRGAEADNNNSGRPGKRQSVDRRGGRRRGGRQGGNDGGNRGAAKPRSSLMDDPSEKAKAEKRAARFAAA